ncbi:uncharacterized protein BO96DRAFT_241528 [Aspergillus niger CBS 101883]|uniref:Uncharacterized protein n=1 Tax=Aspergillus niger ATCC 13496 TaxID=1353008 RepID=A0A370C721_ASPNG|nr:uncharacterized protein BO96DRAFT_241528 [Aspergillus niger CBS 101883]PYH58434.1 hypothetical protein BO96DRAFT_241528 [Aspergillus niger CBS 101883]RDH22801.1 hypothetical protein M747DRAFT_172957 [Aspergillus niger ATCC 13496]
MDGMYRRCSQLTVRRGKYNKGLFITVTKFMTDSLAEMVTIFSSAEIKASSYCLHKRSD